MVRTGFGLFLTGKGNGLPDLKYSKNKPTINTTVLNNKSKLKPQNSKLAGRKKLIKKLKNATKIKKADAKKPVCAVFFPYLYQENVL